MKRIALAGIGLALIGSTTAMADELPLTGVVLSTAGLAQFTHSGEVTPGTNVDLSVRLDQVDDLLKSLTIFDAEGAIGAVSLPGKAPLAELFRDLPFTPDALNSLPALLNALVGAEIEIEGNVTAQGRILRVEPEIIQLPNNGGQKTQHRVTLMTENGMVQAVLEDLAAVRFTDPEAKAQIDRALAGLAQNRAKERRTLSIGLLGESERNAGFSYVVSAPVWKTAYRLVLPLEAKEADDEESTARLQGWGIVENLTGSDWSNVDLTLISGNPVALKQSLYTAFYVDRPEIPVEASTRIVPRRDDVDEQNQPMPAPVMAGPGYGRSLAFRKNAQAYAEDDRSAEMMAEPAPEMSMPAQMGSAALATEAEEASTQVQYRFPEKITLAAGSTMMVPFVDQEITAERSWLYQPETNGRHPLAAVRLKNNSETALPAGIITAFDTDSGGTARFVGDAQLPLMPKGDTKFVTFALDSKTAIRRVDKGQSRRTLGKALNGVLTTRAELVWTIDYEITPPVDEDRKVIIDENRPDGWSVAKEQSEDIEQTAARLRYEVEAPSGETTKTTIKLERVEEQTITLAAFAPEDLLLTLRGLENADDELKSVIKELSNLVNEINKAEGRLVEIENERQAITNDQSRIRSNLSSVGQSSDLGRRYLEALNKQEDRLVALYDEQQKLDAFLADKRKEVEPIARNLKL